MNTLSARLERYSVSPWEKRYSPKRYDASSRKSVRIKELMTWCSQLTTLQLPTTPLIDWLEVLPGINWGKEKDTMSCSYQTPVLVKPVILNLWNADSSFNGHFAQEWITFPLTGIYLGRAWATPTLAWLHWPCVCIYFCLFGCLEQPLTANVITKIDLTSQ